MTRVLLVHQPRHGGVGRHLSDLYLGLRGAGYEVALAGPGIPSASSQRSLIPADVQHFPLSLDRAVSALRDARAVLEYTRIIREVEPDLVHAHSSKAGAVARLGYLAGAHVPVVYTPHGYAFSGHFERQLERSVYRGIERALSPISRAVIAVCEAEARLAVSIGAALVRTVHNGVDPPAIGGNVDPRVAELGRSKQVISAVAQLRPGKGLETLIDAVAIVAASNRSIHTVIAGDGELRGFLSERVRRLGLEEVVTFLGDHPDPMSVLRASTIFVMPSWAEAFPYTILEAMAANVPVVSTDVGGVREALVDQESGLLVPPRNARALAEAISGLVDSRSTQTRLARAADATARTRFTTSSMIAGVVDVYDEVLEKWSPSSARGVPDSMAPATHRANSSADR